MLDFLSRFSIPLSLVAVAVFASVTTYFSEKEATITLPLDSYLLNVVGWLGVNVLFWLWKFERDWKRDLKSELSPKVKENEKLIMQLWNVFSEYVTDTELEEGIRKVLERYPSIVLQQKDDKIGEKVRENVIAAGNILERREYSVYFDAMDMYPGPFYEIAQKSIIATNIGSPDNFWRVRKRLVEMNQKAGARIQPTLKKGEDAIRRVFIIGKNTEKKEINDLKKLMDELGRAGVMINYIGLDHAQKIAVSNRSSLIAGLEDFTVFDTGDKDLKYAGRFRDLGVDYKQVVISSDPQVIESLTRQFQALWNESVRFEGKIKPSVLSRT